MKKLDKNIMFLAATLGAITIGIGAFGAHGLKALVDETALRSFETGVRYQMYHVLALLFLGCWGLSGKEWPEGQVKAVRKTKLWVFRFFGIGILLFSGSLYVLSLGEVLPFKVSFLGPITPIGGLLFVLGWLRLGYGFFTLKSQHSG
ncbi:MAG: DUF423 domain-containing protein [Bacteroidota bacterium]